MRRQGGTDRFQTFEKLLEMAPEDVHLINQVARVHRMKERYDEGEKGYRRALALDPHNFTAMTGIGYCLLQKEDFEPALDMLLQSVELLYSQPVAHPRGGVEGMELYAEPTTLNWPGECCPATARSCTTCSSFMRIGWRCLKRPRRSKRTRSAPK